MAGWLKGKKKSYSFLSMIFANKYALSEEYETLRVKEKETLKFSAPIL